MFNVSSDVVGSVICLVSFMILLSLSSLPSFADGADDFLLDLPFLFLLFTASTSFVPPPPRSCSMIEVVADGKYVLFCNLFLVYILDDKTVGLTADDTDNSDNNTINDTILLLLKEIYGLEDNIFTAYLLCAS